MSAYIGARGLLATAAILLFAGASCSAPTDSSSKPTGNQPLLTKTLSSPMRCAGVSAGVSKLTQTEAQRLSSNKMLDATPGIDPAVTKALAKPANSAQTAPDKPNDPLLLAISHGSQPSAGYRFEMVSAKVHQGHAEISVNWQQPAPGSMQATVMTSPCLVLEIPAAGLQRITVTDQNGEIGQLSLN